VSRNSTNDTASDMNNAMVDDCAQYTGGLARSAESKQLCRLLLHHCYLSIPCMQRLQCPLVHAELLRGARKHKDSPRSMRVCEPSMNWHGSISSTGLERKSNSGDQSPIINSALVQHFNATHALVCVVN
jgi:hypothetical protein